MWVWSCGRAANYFRTATLLAASAAVWVAECVCVSVCTCVCVGERLYCFVWVGLCVCLSWCVRSREMGTSILIFHVSGGSSASPVPASSLVSSPPPPSTLPLSLVTCQWASDSARNANFGASFKTLISTIDNDTETVSPRSQVQVAWVGHRGQRTQDAGSGTGIRAEVDSERSRALQVLVQRMCAGRDLSLAGPSYQLDTPPTEAIHGLPALRALPRSTHPSICCGSASVFLVISGCIGR